MNKLAIYNFCRALRQEDETISWLDIHKKAIKANLITKHVTLPELRSIYRDAAGDVAIGKTVVAPGDYDDDVKAFFDFIGKTKDAFEPHEKKEFGDKQISIIVTDWHVPYHDKEKVDKIVERWAGKADRLIIGGDYLNGSQLSTYPKTVVEDFRKECTEGRILLEYLASKFPEVVLLDDNHVHSRWQRYVSKVLTPDLHFLTIHPYDFLTAGIPNVVRAKATHTFEHKDELGWFYVIGDAVIAHAESHSAVEMRPARKVEEFVRKWGPIFGLPQIRFVAQAHNHKLGMYHDLDSAVAMTGCIVSLEGLTYSMGPELKGSPPIHGYVVLVQENGRTNLEETNVVRLPFKN